MIQNKNKLLVAVGVRVRCLRREAGFSQEALAMKTGLDRSYIGGVERGERNVSMLNIKVIADGLGVSLSDFFKDFK